jgi:copper resistance protein C
MKTVFTALRQFILIAILAAWSQPAQAHAILISSTPGIDGTAVAGTIAVKIKYNSRIDHHRSRLTLSTDTGVKSTVAIDPASPVDEIDATASLKPGHYSLRWQVLAVDGHITRGDIPFTVTEK